MILREAIGEIRGHGARAEAALGAVDRDDLAVLRRRLVRRMRRSTAAARSFGSGGLTRNSWMPARIARSIMLGSCFGAVR